MDNLESKKLTKEDLENVSGGSKYQIDAIICLLEGRGYLDECKDRKAKIDTVYDLLSNAGVTALLYDNKNCNHYEIGGRSADHKDLMEYLCKMYPEK